MFRVVVTGSRGFQDKELLFSKLDFFLQNRKPEEIEIVSGTARGADTMGEKYAQVRGLKVKRFPAEWDRFGKSAGYRRNEGWMQNLLPGMKKYLPWLAEADSQALKYTCRCLDDAYNGFFKSGRGFPKFNK